MFAHNHTALLYFTVQESFEKIHPNAGDIFSALRCYRDMDLFLVISFPFAFIIHDAEEILVQHQWILTRYRFKEKRA